MEMGPKDPDGQDEDLCHKERGGRTAGHLFCATSVPSISTNFFLSLGGKEDLMHCPFQPNFRNLLPSPCTWLFRGIAHSFLFQLGVFS